MKNWVKKYRGSIIGVIGVVIIVFLAIGLFKLKVIRNYDNGRISYRGRTYIKSTVQVMNANMKKNFDKTKPTGKFILGNEVYDIPSNPYDSTVIFLKTRDGKFEIYGLSGGP